MNIPPGDALPIASDVTAVEEALTSSFFNYTPAVGSRIVYVGSTAGDAVSRNLETPYEDVANYMKNQI